MKKAEIIIDKYFLTGKVDKRIFGSFIEHLDAPFTRASIRKEVLSPTSRASEKIPWILSKSFRYRSSVTRAETLSPVFTGKTA